MSTPGELTFRSVMAIIDRHKTKNDQMFPTGARLVCPLPWVHQNAWLHRVPPPCSEEAVATLAPNTGRQPPSELVAFLRCANGLSIFNGSLKVHGVRGDFSRNLESALLLPYDLADHSLAWSRHFGPDDFLIGACGPDVNPCVWRAADGRISRLDQADGRELESWPSFHDWLVHEAERFSSCHHSNGRLRNPLPHYDAAKAKPWPQEPLIVGPPKRWSPAWWHALEELIGLPFGTLPFGWVRKLQTRLLVRLAKWLERKRP